MKRTIGPVTKTTTAATALVLIIVWIFEIYGVEIPAEVAGAVTVLLVALAGWLVPHNATQDGKHETGN